VTANSLQNSVCILKKLRDTHSGQLDTSILVELNEVIRDLEQLDESQKGSTDWMESSSKALQVIGAVIRIVTDISDLMK
jgi:hypothetical protein